MQATTDTDIDRNEPIFTAVLTPYRSLSRGGFAVLMALLVIGWIVAGGFYLSIGAWPVFGFLGLDVLAIYVAFRLNYRSGRASEHVRLSRTELAIRKVAPSGRTREHRFNPFWVRFAVARHAEIGITAMDVVARDARVGLGSFLNPDDRESFATAFGAALSTAKGR